uniref:Cytosolic iron-sulfur assembly component 2B n=1 Tax=Sinocyclocheilus rhinocerous TaxID=307959 RepID=A0A673H679_9TELE
MSEGTRLENANPLIFQRSGERLLTATDEDEDVADPIDDGDLRYPFKTLTSLHLIRSISDPEHPLSLEELNVVEQMLINVNDEESTVSVEFTPTIPHCSMATLIGLSIKVKLLRSLPDRFKVILPLFTDKLRKTTIIFCTCFAQLVSEQRLCVVNAAPRERNVHILQICGKALLY